MQSGSAAKMAANIERGDQEHPFKKVELLGDKTEDVPVQPVQPQMKPSMNFNDFETLVMRQLRQEEERKRLIEEMKRQDAEENA